MFEHDIDGVDRSSKQAKIQLWKETGRERKEKM